MRARFLLVWAIIAWPTPGVSGQTPYPRSVAAPKALVSKYSQSKVAASDGIELVVHEWRPGKAASDGPVLLFLHGIGMHGEPYASIAPGFTAHGVTLVVPDLRSHGRSQGERGKLAPANVLRADLDRVLAFVQKRHPDASVVLGGESMGGLLAADYAWRNQEKLSGLALLAPAFAVHPSQIRVDDLGKALFGKVPLATEEKLKPSTRNDGFIKARMADDLALPQVSLAYLLGIARIQGEWPRAASKLKLPMFVAVAGRDEVVDPKATKAVFDQAGTTREAKVWRRWADARHTLCWDPDTPELIEELARWTVSRTKSKAKERGTPRCCTCSASTTCG